MKAKKWVTFITAGVSAISLICANMKIEDINYTLPAAEIAEKDSNK